MRTERETEMNETTETEGWNDFLTADYVETTRTDCENNAYWM